MARTAGALSRTLRFGAGETLPGRIVRRLSPSLAPSLAAAIADGIVVVSGTNGKTTTASMIATAIGDRGIACASNRTGSNMSQGIISALLTSGGARIGVFEVDEVALPNVVSFLRPSVLVLTNVFRDQLDRFGEPERVVDLFVEASRLLPSDSTIVFNADDPLLSNRAWGRPTRSFGIRCDDPDPSRAGGEPELCPECGAPLVVVSRTFAHMGSFRCSRCAWKSSPPDVLARLDHGEGLRSMDLDVGGSKITIPVGGAYNAYNVAAAVAATDSFGFDRAARFQSLSGFVPRFGRLEQFDFGDHRVTLALTKNAAGANAILRELRSAPPGAAVVAVNDLAADGRDVSWIWDVEFELLRDAQIPVIASGRRAEEVALRLHYADIPAAACERGLHRAVSVAAGVARGSDVCVLATYTAMLELRASLLGRSRSVHDR